MAPPLDPDALPARWRALRDRLRGRFRTLQALSMRAAQTEPPLALRDQAELAELVLVGWRLLRTAGDSLALAQTAHARAHAGQIHGDAALAGAVRAADEDLLAGLADLLLRVQGQVDEHTDRLERLQARLPDEGEPLRSGRQDAVVAEVGGQVLPAVRQAQRRDALGDPGAAEGAEDRGAELIAEVGVGHSSRLLQGVEGHVRHHSGS